MDFCSVLPVIDGKSRPCCSSMHVIAIRFSMRPAPLPCWLTDCTSRSTAHSAPDARRKTRAHVRKARPEEHWFLSVKRPRKRGDGAEELLQGARVYGSACVWAEKPNQARHRAAVILSPDLGGTDTAKCLARAYFCLARCYAFAPASEGRGPNWRTMALWTSGRRGPWQRAWARWRRLWPAGGESEDVGEKGLLKDR